MKRTIIYTAAAIGVLLITAVQAQAQARDSQAQVSEQPNQSLAKCSRDDVKLRDCHIHDRPTYIDMSASRPDWRAQPHAAQEFRAQEWREHLEQAGGAQ
jgi:hypothetical protein